MTFFHSTTPAAAAAILAGGFRDGSGTYGFQDSVKLTGVWLSDVPLDCNEGCAGDTLLRVELDCDSTAVEQYEAVVVEGEGDGYREWLIPSAIVNTGRITLVDRYAEEEEDL